MIVPLALAVLQSGAPALQRTPTPSLQRSPTPASLGGALVTPFVPPLSAGVLPGRLMEVTMNFPTQQWEEKFVLGVPQLVSTPAPVLTLFHGYGERHLDVVQNTALVQDAMARGWIVYIPLGAHIYNYGIEYAQRNIELTFEFLGPRLPIDLDRIYAVGFSMGGGAAASYAARHLDPEGVRFAAIVNHTGTTSLRATYHTSNDTNLFRSPLMFGGAPAEVPFGYLQSSTVDLDPVAWNSDPASEMASNLSHVPVLNWMADLDPNWTILQQTKAFHSRLLARGGNASQTVVTSALHSWSTLDSNATLDWLQQHTLQTPQPGDVTRVLADRNGRWHDLDIVQSRSEEVTPMLWSAQPATDTLYLIEMANLDSVALHLGDVGLDPAQSLSVVVQTEDASAPQIVLDGVPASPTNVLRRGVSTSAWTWAGGKLTLFEPGPAGWANWEIVP
ncbi:MAG: prolyl oligopeptidase family serine peptidase [Planctomycetota bacterium]